MAASQGDFASIPYLTIVTATYNAASTLPRLLESLAIQTCRDFELVIQDGASADQTCALVESFRARLPDVTLRSSPDMGIYDAWNKALPSARGEWILFLGADDELNGAEILKQCRDLLAQAPASALYAGGSVETIKANGRVAGIFPYNPRATEKKHWRSMPFPHQGLWHHRKLFLDNGFEASLRIAGDYDLVCRTWTPENGNTVLPFTVTRMRRGGISDKPISMLRLRWECAVISSRYFSGVWTCSCCLGLLKGCLLWLVCVLLGKRAPAVLDSVRRLRGLPPSWTGL